MLSGLLASIYGTVVFFFELTMATIRYGRAFVPLLTDSVLLLSGAMYFTRLKRPEHEAELPGPGDSMAHRGAYLDAPENSLEAFQYCVSRGCKFVEFDVRTSRDGECVVWHDAMVAGVDIAATDWLDLCQLDTGRRNPAREGVPVKLCRLQDAVSALAAAGVRLMVDIKDMDTRTVSSVARIFQERPELLKTCCVTSFNPIAIYKLRKLEPRITGALTFQPHMFTISTYNATGEVRYRFESSPVKFYLARMGEVIYGLLWALGLPQIWAGASLLLLHRDATSPALLARWNSRGYPVATWPVNLPLDKLHAARTLKVPYLTDTLVGESTEE